MNDVTPRKITGSLLERAAEVYDFREHFRAREAVVERDEEAEKRSPSRDFVAPVLSPIKEREGASSAQSSGKDEGLCGPRVAIDRDHLAQHGFLVPGAPVGVLAEEFRLVKRQLLLTAKAIAETGGRRSRAVLVCSAKPAEGKTFCSLNLALSLAAERDVEVLLVDGDFAKPDVMASLGLEEGPGLLDALADPTIDVESYVVRTDIPKLSLLPAGTKTINDTELLASARTEAVLDGLAAADPRRILIFDSPPALAASPASVLASQVGQVMMVVRADKTGDSDLREAVQLLDGCEHIQLVLNAVTFTPGGARFGSYYGYQGQENAR
ncbi:MAG TPA: AAA family ATPase [Sphingomonas sp.]|nr:AAA family ATPase [Sphingomonas sp.]